jgi:hypothetical protein
MYKKYDVSGNKTVHVYDNYLDLQLKLKVFDFLSKSRYTIGWSDLESQSAISHRYLHSVYSDIDDENCGLLPFLRNCEMINHVDNLKKIKSIVNLSVPSDSHFVHTHYENKIILYYANLEWKPNWHGETLFYNENLTDIDLALSYTPGRVVIFDGGIPHTIRPQSHSADHYRFTYAMMFK